MKGGEDTTKRLNVYLQEYMSIRMEFLVTWMHTILNAALLYHCDAQVCGGKNNVSKMPALIHLKQRNKKCLAFTTSLGILNITMINSICDREGEDPIDNQDLYIKTIP